jgi:hypothetical protein
MIVAGTAMLIFTLQSMRSGRLEGGRGAFTAWIYRDKNPVAFWMSIGFSAAFGVFMFGAAYWLLRLR